ncbi:major capsid protein [Flyfo microvirus Tbat2_116]|nr:major capsid protein [Flyfo microvirus Tbat2_116]
MSQQVTLGGDRLGSGNKRKVELHGYERSTHDLSYVFRTTMSSGTIVPFMNKVALPGDTWDIEIETDINTLPTVGPLFANFKAQFDIFMSEMRLYIGALHNNKLGIGRKMSDVRLPTITLTATNTPDNVDEFDLDNSQINPSCVFKYLGISGVGTVVDTATATRTFNGMPFLILWDVYKNYYSNKQETNGAVIHTTLPTVPDTVTKITVKAVGYADQELKKQGTVLSPVMITTAGGKFELDVSLTTDARNIMIQLYNGSWQVLDDLIVPGSYINSAVGKYTATWDVGRWGNQTLVSWKYRTVTDNIMTEPQVSTFPLENIDIMRERILAAAGTASAFDINAQNLTPYSWPLGQTNGVNHMMMNQEGLPLKTYQSDLFNNWLDDTWIDGPNGVSNVTAISTAGDKFTIDTLILARAVYNLLNRVNITGGTYDDWLDAVYAHERYTRPETPVYMGGLSKEVVFQEVVSNTMAGDQPLGTIAGKGRYNGKHKGGYIHINVDQPSYITGYVSLTPRIDYSQGNEWDVHIKSMDDLHKPALDQIGFEDLMVEQMAWWDTNYVGGQWIRNAAGKQPAWINYMTAVNKTYGNFAIKDNSMFMTLNRRYEPINNAGYNNVKDLTTYIDPVKFNHVFAETSLDAQNFWMQIAVKCTVRRKMSAKVMPNL